jgi:hypothetical protein
MSVPHAWHYVNDAEIRLGQYVAIPPYENSGDIGTVELFDGGWFIRLIGTGELTGPWEIVDLVHQYRAIARGELASDDLVTAVPKLPDRSEHASVAAIDAALTAGERLHDATRDQSHDMPDTDAYVYVAPDMPLSAGMVGF